MYTRLDSRFDHFYSTLLSASLMYLVSDSSPRFLGESTCILGSLCSLSLSLSPDSRPPILSAPIALRRLSRDSVPQTVTRGYVDALALATPSQIFHVIIHRRTPTPQSDATETPNQSTSPLGSREREDGAVDIARVLDHPRALLVGVHMPRLAVILLRITGGHIRGVDLSTLHSNSTYVQKCPAKLVAHAYQCKVQWDRINKLWCRDHNVDLQRRAWVSSW